MPYTGYNNCGCNGRYLYGGGKAAFNAITDVKFSDVNVSGNGGAQILNDTAQGPTYQNDDLIGATIYLLFLDGIQFVQIDEDLEFADPVQKQFKLDNETGIITFAYNIDDPVALTVFYSSSGTTGIPGAEPVTVAEFKEWAKLDTGSLEDDLIAEMITTAREQCEDFTGISIIARTVTAQLNNSCGNIYLPYCPFISLTSIKDYAGNIIDPANYELSNKFTPGLLFPQLKTPWSDNVTLVYVAGYGVPPQKIITAIKQQTFFLYENRGERAIIDRYGGQDRINLSPQAQSTLQRIRRV